MRRNKKAKITVLVLGLILMGIGYAYLTANLKITGTARISGNSFGVHFEDPTVIDASETVTFASNSNSNVAAGTPVVTGTNDTELEWNVTFNAPGDHYEFVVEAVNGGQIDAVEDLGERTLKVKIDDGEEKEIDLSDFANDENWPSYLNFHVDYLDDTSANPSMPYYILPNSSVKLHFEIELSENVDAEQWEAIRGKTIKITNGFVYIQGTGLPSNSNSNNG